jgi:hypothetical protein|eukprot:COSAG01_NODE_4813_length_4725_cov_2.371812_6_plen_125_part_00
MILVPVLWDVLKALHACKLCGFRVAKHLKLGHNVSFHKHVARVIVMFAAVHIFAHYVNYQSRPAVVEGVFGGAAALHWKWGLGCVITMCMLAMYSSAQEAVRRESHQAFWLVREAFPSFAVHFD